MKEIAKSKFHNSSECTVRSTVEANTVHVELKWEPLHS